MCVFQIILGLSFEGTKKKKTKSGGCAQENNIKVIVESMFFAFTFLFFFAKFLREKAFFTSSSVSNEHVMCVYLSNRTFTAIIPIYHSPVLNK